MKPRSIYSFSNILITFMRCIYIIVCGCNSFSLLILYIYSVDGYLAVYIFAALNMPEHISQGRIGWSKFLESWSIYNLIR